LILADHCQIKKTIDLREHEKGDSSMIAKVSGGVRSAGFGVLIFVLAIGYTIAWCGYAHAGARTDIPTTVGGFIYQLDVEGGLTSYFSEAFNMGSETEVVDHKVMGPQGKTALNKIPGKTRFYDITLRRAITANLDLVNWRKLVVTGQISKARKNCVITMFDSRSTPVAIWNLAGAWPSKHLCNPMEDVSATNTASLNAIESVTITFDEIERVK